MQDAAIPYMQQDVSYIMKPAAHTLQQSGRVHPKQQHASNPVPQSHCVAHAQQCLHMLCLGALHLQKTSATVKGGCCNSIAVYLVNS